uniref:SCP domain-containing protein n=1 Tax=Mesocestoides corti TaxID=53468 RepID=A0A5K3FSA8_MESCO
MVWSALTQVGCALKNCPNRDDVSKTRYALVCIYKPGERSVAVRPYESGKSCSRCPDGYGCLRNQCYKDTPTTKTSTSVGTLLPTIEALLFTMLLLHCFE